MKYILIAFMIALALSTNCDPEQQSECPKDSTCCKIGEDVAEVGCCPYASGVCCADFETCCPNGYVCSSKGRRCVKDKSFLNGFLPATPLIKETMSNEALRDMDWDSIGQCIIGKAPFGRDIYELLKSINEKDKDKIVDAALKLIRDGNPAIKHCMQLYKRNDEPEENGPSLQMLKRLNWGSVLRCLLQGGKGEIKQEIKDLIEELKKKDRDITKIAELAYKLYQNGNEIIKECVHYSQVKNELQINWKRLYRCLINISTQIPEILELIKEIKNKEWTNALKIVLSLIEKGTPIIKQCLHDSFNEEINDAFFLTFNWDAFLKCLKSAGTLFGKIKELVLLIKNGHYKEAIPILFRLIEEGNQIVIECMNIMMNSNGLSKYVTKPFRKIYDTTKSVLSKIKLENYKKIIACVKRAAPLFGPALKKFKAFIAAVKSLDVDQAAALLKELTDDGVEIVHACIGEQKKEEEAKQANGILEDLVSISWKSVMKCVMPTDEASKEIKDIMKDIQNKNFPQALDGIYQLILEGHGNYQCLKKALSLVSNDESDTFKLDNSLNINWEKFIKCVMKIAPMTQEGFMLFELVSNKKYAEATALVMKLIKEGKDFYRECLMIGDTFNFANISHWESILACLKRYKSLRIIGLIELLERGEFIQAGFLFTDLIRRGDAIAKSCKEDFNSTEMKANAMLSLDWASTLKCIIKGSEVYKEFKNVIQLIKAVTDGDYDSAIDQLYEAIGDGFEWVKDCINSILPKENKISFPKLNIDWESVLMCIVKESPDAQGTLLELIEALKEKNYILAAKYGLKLIKEGNDIFKKCKDASFSSIKVNFSINWSKVLQCIIDSEVVTDEIIELIKLIKDKEYQKAFSQGYKIIREGSILVKKCFGDAEETNALSTTIDWKVLLGCLVEKGVTLLPEIRDLIKAIKAKDLPKSLELIYTLFTEGNEYVHECLGTPKNLQMNIDWELLVECIKDAVPIGADVLKLIQSIKDKDYTEAINILYKLFREGTDFIKECWTIVKKQSNSSSVPSIDWMNSLQCLIKSGLEGKDIIKDAIDALQNQQIFKLIPIIQKIFSKGQNVYEECLTPILKHSAFLSAFPWGKIEQCIMNSKKPVKSIVHLLVAIKQKDIGKMIQEGLQVFNDGFAWINECIH